MERNIHGAHDFPGADFAAIASPASDSRDFSPPQTGATAILSRAIDAATGEPIVELRPVAPPIARPRVVGPGRLERGYLERIGALEEGLRRELDVRRAQERELETAALCERGATRAADRLERECERLEAERARTLAAHNRMILALGSLQRENELLRERLVLAEAPRRELASSTQAMRAPSRNQAPGATPARGWRRFFGR